MMLEQEPEGAFLFVALVCAITVLSGDVLLAL